MTGEAEAEQVGKWRQRFFERLGFDPADAISLTVSPADPHDVERALTSGCTHAQALLIFL
jgi:hypothetical protein